jgi:hypothetical protein
MAQYFSSTFMTCSFYWSAVGRALYFVIVGSIPAPIKTREGWRRATGARGCHWSKQIGTTPLGDNFDRWRRHKRILLSPHRHLKGLEAGALILADVPRPNSKPHFSTADFYVACSRAKHHVTIVGRAGA